MEVESARNSPLMMVLSSPACAAGWRGQQGSRSGLNVRVMNSGLKKGGRVGGLGEAKRRLGECSRRHRTFQSIGQQVPLSFLWYRPGTSQYLHFSVQFLDASLQQRLLDVGLLLQLRNRGTFSSTFNCSAFVIIKVWNVGVILLKRKRRRSKRQVDAMKSARPFGGPTFPLRGVFC